MLWESEFDPSNPSPAFDAMVEAWKTGTERVYVLRNAGEIGDVRAFYQHHFAHLGTPRALAEDVNVGDRDNQRSGEIWMEVRYDPRHPDAYRHSANAQPLHTDGSYIPSFPNATLLACVANAGMGGETTFVASDDVVAALEKEAEDLLLELSSEPFSHCRSGDVRVEKVIDRASTPALVNWNYYCIANDLSPKQKAMADRFFDFLRNSPTIHERTLAVKLAPGDGIMWKDRQVLHGRNGFVANRESERFIWKCAIDVGEFA